MNLRKNLGLMIGGAVVVVVLVVVLIVLWRGQSAYRTVDRQLQASLQRFTQLNQQNPYPSEENVQRAGDKLAQLQAYLRNLTESMRRDQIEPVQIEPAEFSRLLETTVGRLREAAAASKVELPASFAFGFDRYYLQGELPGTADIPRLVVELKTVETLCMMMYEARVTSVDDVLRDLFDESAARGVQEGPEASSRTRRRQPARRAEASAGAKNRDLSLIDTDLYSAERYVLAFSGRETAVWDLLDALGRCQMSVRVSDVRLTGSKPAARTQTQKQSAQAGQGKAGPSAGSAVTSAELLNERMVAGQEAVKVQLDIEVHRFKSGAEETAL